MYYITVLKMLLFDELKEENLFSFLTHVLFVTTWINKKPLGQYVTRIITKTAGQIVYCRNAFLTKLIEKKKNLSTMTNS